MEAQEHPIRHFARITELAAALKSLPAQVLERSYSYEAFGSWSLAVL